MERLSPEARALIAKVANADGPSLARRERVERELARALALNSATLLKTSAVQAGTATPTVATGTKLTASALWWLLGGGAIGALMLVPLARLGAFAPTPHASNAVVASARPTPRAAPSSSSVTDVPVLAREPAPRVTPTAERAAHNEHPPKPEPLSAPIAADEGVAAETLLLESAQRALAARDAEHALALLAEHAQRFPNGALTEERGAARVLALCELGRTNEARSAFAAFLRTAPRSPLIPRLQDSCASSSAGGVR